MRLRWCALGMVAGLGCVVAGLGLAVSAQLAFPSCGVPCPEADARERLAVELSLVGVIVSSLATAALAGLLMRTARPPIRRPALAPPDASPTRR